jgi:hypothetical protein
MRHSGSWISTKPQSPPLNADAEGKQWDSGSFGCQRSLMVSTLPRDERDGIRQQLAALAARVAKNRIVVGQFGKLQQ